MSNIITSGTTFQNDLDAANIAATTATTQANIAYIYAQNAASSASRAFTSAVQAQNSAINASNSASLAAVYANTARTANTISLTSVTNTPAGSAGWVQISGGNGFTGSSNLTFTNNQLSVIGTVNSYNANIIGNLTTITVAATTGNIANLTATSASVTGNVRVGGNLSVVGTITGTFTGNGAGLSDVAPINSPTFTGVPAAPTAGSGTNTTQLATTAFVQQAISNFTGISGSNFSVTGNITSGQSFVANSGVTATGNVTGGNLRTTGIITATGNITSAGNLSISGAVQANGNLTIGNITSTGNVIGANLRTTGAISATGNVLSGGLITGNITANGAIQAINANVTSTLSISGGIKQNQFTKLGSSTGQPGQIVWDTNYIYVCTATNVWKRVALTSF